MRSKYSAFILKQFNQVKLGGWSILLKKILAVPLLITAVPATLLVRILRPFICIRFGQLKSDRIGHFIINTEFYLCLRDMGMHGSINFDIFYYNAHAANVQIKKMWDRALCVWSFGKWIDKVNRLIPGGKDHIISLETELDVIGFLKNTKPHVSFTYEEEEFGYKEIYKLGIPAANPFVCFQVRDSSYLDKLSPGGDWSYHNYRNATVSNYLLALQELVKRNYYAVRMGAVVGEKLIVNHPQVIDYAVNNRTDFLDAFLSDKCKFFITDTAGIGAFPLLFRRPIVFVNYIPVRLVNTAFPDSLIIPKKLWLKSERRVLTFREIFTSEIGSFGVTQKYVQAGIEVIENTAEEIAKVAVEMDERLKGTWQTTDKDEALQRRFWDLFHPKEEKQIFLMRVGASFLRRNEKLLA